MQFNEINFRFTDDNSYLKRNIEITLDLLNGEKTKNLSEKYKISTTTVLHARRKICRSIFFSLHNTQINIDDIQILRETEFKCELGINLVKRYLEFINQKLLQNPKTKWLDKPEEVRNLHKIISSKITTLIERAEKKRMYHIQIANKEFLSLKRQLMELLTSVISEKNPYEET